jgi:tetratricopeptide (TPR) repeat protein
VITRSGGIVEKFIGDAVMAVWGAPIAHEDDPERAVRAALDLVDVVRQIGPGIEARAGIMTGEAAVTLGATNQGMVAGDLVNTAARLQSVAAAGSVLVGEAAFHGAREVIQFEFAGEQQLKGKRAPFQAWRAVRIVAERRGRNRSDALEAPFVGRDEELRLLKDLFHATGRDRRTRLVSLIGIGGIGKSRLAWEFLKYVDGVVESTFWHSGRSPAYGEGITFWALGEMVRSRCGLAETDDEPTTRQKVADAVAQWVPQRDERDWIEQALLALLGVETSTTPDQLFAAWRTFFERIASSGTVVLVFEDLHHADSGLLDFIDHVVEWTRGQPIYLVTLARPELVEKRPAWGAGKRNFTSTYLEPLADSEMRDLLSGLVPGLPPNIGAMVVERAAGVPLYAVETVRKLIADGLLRPTDDGYESAGDLAALAVPETLTALIASRIDGLDQQARSVLHDAAVLGQSFTTSALAAVSGRLEGDLPPRLADMVKREFLAHETDPRSPEVGQYRFVQALVREVAYNTLAKRDRKTRHLAAARFFEQLDSDELVAVLAGHYLAAKQNAGDEAEAAIFSARAASALRGAGERAASLGAHDQAVAFLEEAVAATQDLATRADMLETAAESARIATRFDRALSLFERAKELRVQLGDRINLAHVAGRIGRCLVSAHRDREALDHLSSALAAYEDLWPDPSVVEIRVNLAAALNQHERHDEVLATLEPALAAAERSALDPLLAEALLRKGLALALVGRLREGTALVREGLAMARERKLDELALLGLITLGFLLGEVDLPAAVAVDREGLALARQIGHRTRVLHFIVNLAGTAFVTGEWAEVLPDVSEALASDPDPASRIWLMGADLSIRAGLGENIDDGLAELKRLTDADGNISQAIPVLDLTMVYTLLHGRLAEARAAGHAVMRVRPSEAYAPYQAARPALWSGDLEGAQADLAALEAVAVPGTLSDARLLTIRAGIAALEGRTDESAKLYRQALGLWRTTGRRFEEALAGMDVAIMLGPAVPAVIDLIDDTRQILERLGSRPLLARLDEAMAAGGSEPSSVRPRHGEAVPAGQA